MSQKDILPDALSGFCKQLLPRLLTQVARDPSSPDYGSFDRNYWHYKIRDFSSIILQQGGYALFCASLLPEFGVESNAMRGLAEASCVFWNKRAVRYGAFEEYYPWEQGYPPLAFSTLAVAKLVDAGVVSLSKVGQGLQRAARQLGSRFEAQATNQQVAGMAALCWVRKVSPTLVEERTLQDIIEKTLACQHPEGWYMEYGGPDLGYLSVTMDCLWDAYDATHDNRLLHSAERALLYISEFAIFPSKGGGMHNARNTDYIVPYGIARFLDMNKDLAGIAISVLRAVFVNLNNPSHFTKAIDDRYYCHYIGHSFYRALPLIRAGLAVSDSTSTSESSRFFSGSGHWLFKSEDDGMSLLCTARKGGILTLFTGPERLNDFGWLVESRGRVWVSHWWSDLWTVTKSKDDIKIVGHLTRHKENISTPFKHLALRGLSLLLGRHVIGLLKEKLIFKANQRSGPYFSREVKRFNDHVVVTDKIEVPQGCVLKRAPRFSKRHVASADSFHVEDFAIIPDGIRMKETRCDVKEGVQITTEYWRCYEGDNTDTVL